MEIIVTDRESIEAGIVIRSAYVVISIRDPDRKRAKVRKQSGLRDVLYLDFHDAEPITSSKLPNNIQIMTEEQANKIWVFVRKWEKQVGTIVVHCEQGMSRSPGVAAALCRGFGGDDSRYFHDYAPNQFVYGLMLKCFDAQP